MEILSPCLKRNGREILNAGSAGDICVLVVFWGFLLSIKDNKLAANDVYFVNYSPRAGIWANHTSKLEHILERSVERFPYFLSDKLQGKYLICENFLCWSNIWMSRNLECQSLNGGKSWSIRKVFEKHILNTERGLSCGQVDWNYLFSF